jgi:nucleoside-diphosphate-sugar epimerase
MPNHPIIRPFNPLTADLNHILTNTEGLWEELRGKRIFLTGGTGFFGSWLLESFAWANEKFNLDASTLVLTRDYNVFLNNAPHLANCPAIKFFSGDVRNFDFPEGEFSHIIHAAATSAAATYRCEDPLVKFDTVLEGTRRVLDFAFKCHAKKILFTSSGAVYGKQPSTITNIPEDYNGAPDPADLNSVWGESKRAAELLCALYSKKYGIETKIARCFTFVGPYLPLNIHYAIGNFIRDGLNGGPIQIEGDGTPYRSYLYAADLAIWLWTILFKGMPCCPYNVGSEDAITIAELAEIVSKSFHEPVEVRVAKISDPNKTAERYVPSTRLAREHCHLRQEIDIRDSINRTIEYLIWSQ